MRARSNSSMATSGWTTGRCFLVPGMTVDELASFQGDKLDRRGMGRTAKKVAMKKARTMGFREEFSNFDLARLTFSGWLAFLVSILVSGFVCLAGGFVGSMLIADEDQRKLIFK